MQDGARRPGSASRMKAADRTAAGVLSSGRRLLLGLVCAVALGLPLMESVELAKNHITQSIHQSVRVGHHTTLNPFWT